MASGNRQHTTSKKHCNFITEPMEEKEVEKLAGIDIVLGCRMRERGFGKVRTMYSRR